MLYFGFQQLGILFDTSWHRSIWKMQIESGEKGGGGGEAYIIVSLPTNFFRRCKAL